MWRYLFLMVIFCLAYCKGDNHGCSSGLQLCTDMFMQVHNDRQELTSYRSCVASVDCSASIQESASQSEMLQRIDISLEKWDDQWVSDSAPYHSLSLLFTAVSSLFAILYLRIM